MPSSRLEERRGQGKEGDRLEESRSTKVSWNTPKVSFAFREEADHVTLLERYPV